MPKCPDQDCELIFPEVKLLSFAFVTLAGETPDKSMRQFHDAIELQLNILHPAEDSCPGGVECACTIPDNPEVITVKRRIVERRKLTIFGVKIEVVVEYKLTRRAFLGRCKQGK